MALNDIFTIPFLISLGITLLLVSLLSVFTLQRFNDQNHKISSMVELVSTMAEELNFIRNRLQITGFQPMQGGKEQQQQQNFHKKINVSDDEEEDDDDEEEEDEEEEDEDEEDEEEDEDEDEDEEEDEEDKKEENIKVVKLDEDYNINYEKLNESEVNERENNHLDEKEIVTVSNDELLQSIDLNSELTYSNNKEFEIQEYKKLSLSKLKSIVMEKGLIADPEKLNKKKLLSLLGVE